MQDKQNQLKSDSTAKRAASLSKVLDQNEHAKNLVEECAEDLSSVNTALKQELAEREPLPEMEKALEKSINAETKVQEATDDLAAVNHALEAEVREREVLEHELAEAKAQEAAARQAAFHDPLTGLPNRVLFNDRLEHGLTQARRHGWKLALMFVDLDDFKNINDSHGHDVGDKVLQLVAERLKGNTRGDDTVCRHGGDEFLYLLMEIEEEDHIIAVAEKILKAIQLPCDVLVNDHIISSSIRASLGIAIFPKNGDTPEALVRRADEAMYRAKREKSGYCFADNS